jgi:signal transduction histidine kinase/ActR/RegA family two-component response regulator
MARRVRQIAPAPSVATSEPALAGPHHDHLVHFYADSAFPGASVVDFLWAGLSAGESAVIVATPEHRATLRRGLAERGAVDALERSGQLGQLDARTVTDTFMAGDLPDSARFRRVVGDCVDQAAAAAPSGRVRAYGECAVILAAEHKMPAVLAVEQLWNEMLSTRRCALYCAYPMQLFAQESLAAPFLQVCDAHAAVIPMSDANHAPGSHGRYMAVLEQQARALETQIAERRSAERRLVEVDRQRSEALRRLAEADRHKDEFLALLGHELRNPLAPITTALELMDQRSDPCCRRERAVLRRQVEHMKRLVDDLMDVSRVTRGKIELRSEVLELSAVVAHAVEMASPLLEQRGHRLSTAVPEGLRIHADPFRLCQIVSNLLTNAATYTDRGGRVTLAARREGDAVVLDVTDSGHGIEPALLPHLFELFVQGDRALDRAQGGLGLGLPLARMLAELHGGTLAARSEGPERGSTFSLRLPLAQAEVTPPAAVVAAVPRGRRVLVVDDNRDAADLLASLLKESGYEVTVAYDGPEAVAAAARAVPDVALLDLGLPGMDGYELAERLQATRAGAPLQLIALSGYGLDADRSRSRAVGFDIHLVKPVALDTLLRTLEAQAGKAGKAANTLTGGA